MSVHLWVTPLVTLCGLVEPPRYDSSHTQCQDCYHLAAGHEYHGAEIRLKVASAFATQLIPSQSTSRSATEIPRD